ncbi:MAG: 2-succinyl-5-enolpyruvyl-6-hydroxy-3-cyclohexene-1-carboxylic-acid synthase, partial [Actinomycetota bacterium]
MSPPAGPVHLNLRFDEPLMPTHQVTSAADGVPDIEIGRSEPDESSVTSLAADLSGRRGVVIAGTDSEPGLAEAAAAFAAAVDWPILADPLSGLRTGPHDRSRVLAASDALAWAGYLDVAQPGAVVRFGGLPTSKPVWQWLGNHREVLQVFIEPAGWRDPTFSASVVLRSEVVATLELLAKAVGAAADGSWITAWREADRAAAAAVTDVIENSPFPNEPMVARIVSAATPDPGVLWVASSMPVRDLDAVMPLSERRTRVLANRGANGIDGFVSTVLGSAAVSGTATVALAGDLSVRHDVGALATAARLSVPVTIVTINTAFITLTPDHA